MRQTHYSDNQYYYTQKWNKGVCLQTITDYSPFGVTLDGRTMQGDAYRYGFNGMEKDDEVKGEGNSVNYKYRMHDPRVGRFFAVDPLSPKYPHNSPYSFSENIIISHVELEGLEKALAKIGRASNVGTGKLIICTSENVAEIAKKSVEGTMFDYMFVESLEDAKKYAQEYMEEHCFDNLDMLVYFNHSSAEGVTVHRKRMQSEYGHESDPPEKKDKVTQQNLSDFVEGNEMTDGNLYETGIFVDIANMVKTNGTYVQLSCLVRDKDGGWGENLSKSTKHRFNIYVNGDYSSTFPKKMFGIPLTSTTCYKEGWFLYPQNSGTEQPLNNSIEINGNTGEVSPSTPNYEAPPGSRCWN
jgi:RHS repeat-associated protein